MPISAAIGIATAIGSAVADVGAAVAGAVGLADVGAGVAAADVGAGLVGADVAGGVAAADVAGGVAAADVAGATALPEILVTPAVAGAADVGAAAAGAGALTGAEAAGAAGLVGGLTAIPETFGAGGAGAAISPTEALSGAAAPTAALAPSDLVGQDFGALTAAGIGPAVDISGAGTGLGPAADTALSFAPATAPIDPLTGVGGGGGGLATDAFAGAPPGELGTVSGDVATALNTGQIGGLSSPSDIFTAATEPGTVGQLTGGTGIPTPAAMEVPGAPAPEIPATIAAPTSTASATPGAADINAISASTGALPAGTSLSTPGGLTPAGTSLFSGSTLRTAAMLAPLGALGLTLARGQPSLPPAEQQALRNVSPGSPISNVAQTNLNEAATGILQPGQLAQINQYSSNAKNQLYQLYARMGRDPTGDTDYIQGLAQIDQNAQIMGQKFIDAAVTNGLNAQGVIDSTLQNAAQMQVASDNAFQAALSSSLSSLGLVAALSARA